MTAPRITASSFWLLAGHRLRISYNTRLYDWHAAAFLKIDVLQPRGARSGHTLKEGTHSIGRT